MCSSDLSSNNEALFLTDVAGFPHLIARTGDSFSAGNKVYGVPSSVYAAFGSGGEDGMTVSLNDQGEFAFRLYFTNVTEGIFVATVPEPATLTLLALAPLAALVRRRRR